MTHDKWEAESDARALTEAEAIKVDSGRMSRAKVAAKRMVKEEQVKTDALKKVAKGTIKGKKK